MMLNRKQHRMEPQGVWAGGSEEELDKEKEDQAIRRQGSKRKSELKVNKSRMKPNK